MPLIWEKWLWLKRRLYFEGRYRGKVEGNKCISGTFLLNFGCQMEPLFKPLHTSDFQNYASRSSRKQNLEKFRHVCRLEKFRYVK